MVPSPFKTRIFYNFIMADDAIQVSSIEFFAWMPGICTLAAASLRMIKYFQKTCNERRILLCI